MMFWLQSSGGLVGTNLDQVRQWVANNDGSVTFTGVSGDTFNVSGIGTDQASAAEAMRRITQAVDPADY
jgi:hypothetical protein